MSTPLCPECAKPDNLMDEHRELEWDEEADELKCPRCSYMW